MIARIWHGKTPAAKADEYAHFLTRRAIPDYRSVDGNCAAYVLRRDSRDESHFLTLTFWGSDVAIEAFAGKDIHSSKYYPEDDSFLLEFEPTVTHYEVVSAADEGSLAEQLLSGRVPDWEDDRSPPGDSISSMSSPSRCTRAISSPA